MHEPTSFLSDHSTEFFLIDPDSERADLLRNSLQIAGFYDVVVIPESTDLLEKVAAFIRHQWFSST